jgi:hypothetical protein
MKISKIHLAHLRNDEHFQLHDDFRDLTIKYGPETLKVGPIFEEYKPLFEKVDEALKKIVKSAVTEKIHDADRARDEVWRGLKHMIYAALNDFDQIILKAAKRLEIVFNTYGNIAKKPINEETSAIYNILQELNGKYAEDIKTVGAERWVEELEIRNNAFKDLMKERHDEATTKVYTSLRHARTDIDKVYRRIIKRMEAYIEIEGINQYEEYVKTLNDIVNKYAMAVAVRNGRSAAKRAMANDDETESEETGDM